MELSCSILAEELLLLPPLLPLGELLPFVAGFGGLGPPFPLPLFVPIKTSKIVITK